MTQEEMIRMRHYYQFCIHDLKFALEHVSQKYVRWTIGANSNEDNPYGRTAKNYCERVFAYELYHQFRKLMCDNERYQNLFFNGEQQKDNTHFKNLLDVIQKDKIIPDLVLHENIGTHECGGQILFIEIKTRDNDNVFSDLLKLSGLTNTKLNFCFYVFVYVDGTIKQLEEKIKGERKARPYEKLDDNIICICVKNQRAHCISIKEIKDRITNNQ